MVDIVILYWEPGTGGDTLQKILASNVGFRTVIKQFIDDDNGRTKAIFDPWFLDSFDHVINNWYYRDWTERDIEKLFQQSKRSNDSVLVLPTHRKDQAHWLQQQIPKSRTLGIYYTKNMYPCVLINWCKKVMTDEIYIPETHNQSLHKNLLKRGLFGPYFLNEQLNFGSKIPKESLPEWDYNIDLQDLLIGDLSSLLHLGIDLDISGRILSSWVSNQKFLYRRQWTTNLDLIDALGINYRAPRSHSSELNLDLYDKILLKYWSNRHLGRNYDFSCDTLEKAEKFIKNKKRVST